ncbi:hypothetical protein SJI19_14365 [Acerihabitans sp. TG2]|uniref:hypothetical protein n=1 Tax=Acerihabitans sp. TG2 TaxID=3096008 RepID=UPI002B233669|nr:hypothetical protein [Acerihabitans sp. TG2]MEA9391712.1 hypothetical protein [Acerihabitans sp. TG2]
MMCNSPIVVDRLSIFAILRATASGSLVNHDSARPTDAILAAHSSLSWRFYQQYHRYCHRHQGMTQDSRAGEPSPRN